MKIISTTVIALTLGLAANAEPISQMASQNLPADVRATLNTPADLTSKVMGGLALSAPVTNEGVDVPELPTSPGPVLFVTQRLMDDILAKSAPEDQKIIYFEKAAAKIVERSGTNENEEILRMTLNRAVDVTETVLPVISAADDTGRQVIENFLRVTFELAKEYAPTEAGHSCRWLKDQGSDWSDLIEIVSYGHYGVRLAEKISQTAKSGGLTRTAKAVLMIKAVQYLGWDILDDYHTRPSNQMSQEILAQIIDTQQDDRMKTVLAKIGGLNGPAIEPDNRELGWLRGRLADILEKAKSTYTK